MEFLPLLLVYVALFFLCVVLYLYRDAEIFQTGLLGKVMAIIKQVLMLAIPQSLKDIIYNGLHTILYRRNQFMKLLFGVLVVAGNVTCIIDLLPLLYKYRPDQNHILVPIINAFLSLYLYHRCCTDDPGEITPQNLERYMAVYPYDRTLYVPDTKCRTCKFVKPARSKHCSICDRCVHRFDHHCLWTNNDVGGLNHGYFVLFLISMMFKCIWGCYVGILSLVLYTKHNKLLEASVIDRGGNTVPVTYSVVFQHLFMQFPRLVFIVTSLFFLIILLGIFTIYHINIVLTNRTTNERYKLAEIEQQTNKSQSSTVFIYDKGILGNLYDTFCQNSIVRRVKVR